jgi:methionyl aminopeptidase
MSIIDPAELEGVKRAGAVTRQVLDTMKAAVRPGISTRELDHIALEVMQAHGARSAPQLVYDFPGATCISVNEEIVHGIPGARLLVDGDLVKLDVTVELDGYMTDACETVAVGRAGRTQRELIASATRAFSAGYEQVHPGARVDDIGGAVQAEVTRSGFSVVRELTGHGIGRTIHEDPMIPNYREPHNARVLTEGLVFTIEPLIAQWSGRIVMMLDGWTIRTRDHSLSAHYEHTVVVTADGAELLTA